MPSPFPGMDPYLESPEIWPDVHHGIISLTQRALNPSLRPKYVARVELRVYVSNEDDPGRSVVIPDVRIDKSRSRNGARTRTASSSAIAEAVVVPMVAEEEIEEAYLEIRHLASKKLVTIIEVLSPSNKIRGSSGRASFLSKRKEALASKVHWVEIDLMRGGRPSLPLPAKKNSDYRILVCRGDNPTEARCWPVSVRQPLPVIAIPLRHPDPDVPLDLGAIMQECYEHAAYDLSVDYRKKPDPPLAGSSNSWATGLLRSRGLR